MINFIDDEKKKYGVESICRILPIAPSTYYRIKDEQNNGSGFVFVPFADNTTYAKKAIADAGYGSYILE